LGLNAHVDVVAPYFPPRVEDGVVLGRGACDDKGGVVAMLGALRVAGEALAEAGARPRREIVCMFVIDEESGGNGSLSLALDRDLCGGLGAMVVLECTGNRLHPANRGAVWYRVDVDAGGGSALEACAFVVEEMELEGRAIRAESRHALFPQRPVQTCHGMIGGWGEHPSRICGEVGFEVCFEREPEAGAAPLLADLIECGLAEYTGLYGDKTKVTDPETGRPKVARHYALEFDRRTARVTVYGSTGHMGSILENDGAITKAAAMVRALVRSRGRLERLAGCGFSVDLSGQPGATVLVMEGGQGFVPTHGIEEITARVRGAAERGLARWRLMAARQAAGSGVCVTFEKLHNDAFDGDPDSPAMRRAMEAAKAAGLWRGEPVVGWTVSCDARLFARQYPGLPVITFGPGRLAHAHSDEERLSVGELMDAVAFLAAYIVMEAGNGERR
jgi:acetylornithine deacetylase/succinyl-diaminopimelate desuccinylase-like protein